MASSLIVSCKGKTFDVLNSNTSIQIVGPDGVQRELEIYDIDDHEQEYIKIGYCASMKVMKKGDNEFIRIRLPKKEDDLRDFFDYHGTKASYDLMVSDCNPKYIYYGKLVDMTAEQCNAYLCGLISAHCSVNLSGEYRRQCIRFRLPEKREQNGTDQANNKWFDFYQKISKCITYTSGNGLGVVCSIPNLDYFIRNIGIIQNDKMADIVRLYFAKIDKSKDYDVIISD